MFRLFTPSRLATDDFLSRGFERGQVHCMQVYFVATRQACADFCDSGGGHMSGEAELLRIVYY